MIIDLQNSRASKFCKRIVSLVPSQTELLYDLGLEEEVIGITKFCVHPSKWHQTKTRVGGTKNVNIETIGFLKPDLIIANREENLKEQVEELSKHFDVLVTDVSDLGDALNMIKNVGILVGRNAEAFELVNQIEAGFQKLKDSVQQKRKVKAAYLIWKNPYMTVGGDTFINNMMQYCRLENIFSSRKRYPQISIHEIIAGNCELVILSTEPYPFKEKDTTEMQSQLPGIQIIAGDGEMFSWYGSRLLKAAPYFEIFCENLHR